MRRRRGGREGRGQPRTRNAGNGAGFRRCSPLAPSLPNSMLPRILAAWHMIHPAHTHMSHYTLAVHACLHTHAARGAPVWRPSHAMRAHTRMTRMGTAIRLFGYFRATVPALALISDCHARCCAPSCFTARPSLACALSPTSTPRVSLTQRGPRLSLSLD